MNADQSNIFLDYVNIFDLLKCKIIMGMLINKTNAYSADFSTNICTFVE